MGVPRFVAMAAIAAIAIPVGLGQAKADKLDDVINNGTLRCGVVLDFPPIGFRDADNNPVGFDVEYCKDLAKALEVDFEILPVTWAERLPVIVTNRADGTGEVGAEVVITKVVDIRRVEGEDLTLWRQVSRRSSDGGKTWTGPE